MEKVVVVYLLGLMFLSLDEVIGLMLKFMWLLGVW